MINNTEVPWEDSWRTSSPIKASTPPKPIETRSAADFGRSPIQVGVDNSSFLDKFKSFASELVKPTTDAYQEQKQIFQAGNEGEVSPGITGFRTSGNVAKGLREQEAQFITTGLGGVNQFLDKILPENLTKIKDSEIKVIKNVASNIFGGIAESEPVQNIVQKFQALPEDTKKNIEAGANLALLFVPYLSKGYREVQGVTGELSPSILQSNIAKSTKDLGSSMAKKATAQIEKADNDFLLDLITPKPTETVRKKIVASSTEEGILKNRVRQATPQEKEIISTVKTLNLPKGESNQFYYIKINEAADNLKQELDKSTAGQGIWNKNILKSTVKQVEIPFGLQDKPKTINRVQSFAENVFSKVKGDAGGFRQASLEFRKKAKSQFGTRIWDGQTPLSQYIMQVNEALNKKVGQILPENKILGGQTYEEAVRRHNNLINAAQNVQTKAALEADNMIGRALQKAGILIKTRAGISSAAQLAGLGIGAIVSPGLATTAGLSWIAYKGGKYVLRPEARLAFSKVLQQAGDTLGALDKEGIQYLLDNSDDIFRPAINTITTNTTNNE